MNETDPASAASDAVEAEEVGRAPVAPLPDDLVDDALRGEPEAQAAVDEGWERAKSMDGEAPTG